MNYIYDVVLNFNDYKDVYDFYEWRKEDNLFYVEKIPIFVVNTFQMEEILFSRIRISNKLLESVRDKTILEKGVLDYCFLVTNRERVIGLRFNSSGELIESSYLLLDEEEAVMEEVNGFNMDYLEYEIYNDNCSINNKYKVLINDIKNNYKSCFNKLYEIIELSKEKC